LRIWKTPSPRIQWICPRSVCAQKKHKS
jgi:hypothetical protein